MMYFTKKVYLQDTSICMRTKSTDFAYRKMSVWMAAGQCKSIFCDDKQWAKFTLIPTRVTIYRLHYF